VKILKNKCIFCQLERAKVVHFHNFEKSEFQEGLMVLENGSSRERSSKPGARARQAGIWVFIFHFWT
jgi:hypothetical protein